MKISYVCGLVILVLSAMLVPSPAQAGTATLEWTAIEKPGEDNNLVVSPSEVSEIAVGNDDVIYAIDGENAKVYRSLDAGVSWKDVSRYLINDGAELPASKIAIAPDKPGIVAVVTDDGTEVYLSTDGGVHWTNTGVWSLDDLEGTIEAIAISSEYAQGGDEFREIAIGTAVWGDSVTSGQVWVRQLGKFGTSWQNQDLTIDPSHTGGEVSALAYSPDYQNDATILAIASTSGDVDTGYQNRTWLCVLERDISAWNNLSEADYPVEIAPAGDGPGVSWIHSSLALPSNYSSEEASSRQIFVSYDREPEDAGDDVHWLNDDERHQLNINGGDAIDISSIAYNGTLTSGKLLAGEVNPIDGSSTVQVWRTSEPFESSPTWYPSTVPPTGPGNAKLGWSPDGEIAYCGTSKPDGVVSDERDESAFSASLDGDKWRQLGLMDTEIRLADIAVAPDGESLFITTRSPYGPEGVWRSAGDPLGERWERLLTIDACADAVILRPSPNYDDDYTMYAVEVAGNQLAVTHTRGNSWQWIERAVPGPIIDMAVVDEETVYVALPEGYVRKSTNGGKHWRRSVATQLSEINMLAIADEETILVGGKNGDVAYSTDGGASFTRIREVIGNGSVQAIADVSYSENGVIYAATNLPDEGIWRWTIGVSTEWEQIDESITELGGGQRIGGLAVGPEGTLYALRLEPATNNSGGVTRSLNPLEAEPEDVELDLVNDSLPAGAAFDPTSVFPDTYILPYLKLSENDEQNELWTIDTANQTIYHFQDTLCKFSPIAVTPEAGDIIPVDSAGYVTSLTLTWEELADATRYEVEIYLDSDAAHSLWSETTAGIGIDTAIGNNSAQLMSDTTYYWRVRSIEPVKSPWSDTWSFTPALGAGQWSPVAAATGISPLPGATNVPIRPTFAWQSADRATGYEFMLARDSGFAEVVIAMTGADALPTAVWGCDRDLEYSTTYFWRVRAIGPTSGSEWGNGVFTTQAAPPETVSPQPSPPPAAPAPPVPSSLIWVLVGIITILVAALLFLIVRTGK